MGHMNGGLPQAVGGRQQYLIFMLGGETHAVSIAGIKEIIQYGGVTGVPCVPDYIRGVINLRGAVVPVLDLGARFGRGISAQGRRSCIVVIEAAGAEGHHDIGVMVDAVNAVQEIGDDDIELPPAFGASMCLDFIQGMGKVNDRFIVILNMAAVLAMDEIAVPFSATEHVETVHPLQPLQPLRLQHFQE